jgi:NTP pyrophosphatase (non-canonical NTP hydrolase)
MWEKQSEQQQSFGMSPSNVSPNQRSKIIRDLLLGLYEEAHELSSAVQYKKHILRAGQVDKINVVEEIVDVFKYTICIAQMFNITPEEVIEEFAQKTQVIADRASGVKLELEGHTKLIITDLDGCVCDLSSWTQELDKHRTDGPITQGMVNVLEKLKTDFYRGGGFRDMPIVLGAKDALYSIRASGYKLAIITARPHWQYKRLYADTIFWLKKHGIEYDLILFNKDKSEAIYEYIFPARPTYFIEDRAKHCLELVNIGVPVLWLGGDASEIGVHPLIRRVGDWKEITKVVMETQLDGGNEDG